MVSLPITKELNDNWLIMLKFYFNFYDIFINNKNENSLKLYFEI